MAQGPRGAGTPEAWGPMQLHRLHWLKANKALLPQVWKIHC